MNMKVIDVITRQVTCYNSLVFSLVYRLKVNKDTPVVRVLLSKDELDKEDPRLVSEGNMYNY